jgi:hypothetical protein
VNDYPTEEFEISNISNEGHAWGESLDSQSKEVCLGPLKCDESDVITGAVVSTERSPEYVGICVDDTRWTDRYIRKMVEICDGEKEDRVVSLLQEFESITPIEIEESPSNESQLHVAGKYELEITYFSSSGMAWGTNPDVKGGMVLLGSIDSSEGDVAETLLIEDRKQTPEKVGICLSTDLWSSNYNEQMRNTFASENRSAADEIINKVANLDILERDSGSADAQEYETPNTDSGTVENESGLNGQSRGTDTDSSTLRQEAEESGTRTVPKSTTTSRRSTQEYTRSAKVKEYVKSRADGVCEGCGDPAPFTSKTGEPYLHAHHVHEVSEGGSDTVDSVIALCPNCHYKIHHGEDGGEYNQELMEKLEKLEGYK